MSEQVNRLNAKLLRAEKERDDVKAALAQAQARVVELSDMKPQTMRQEIAALTAKVDEAQDAAVTLSLKLGSAEATIERLQAEVAAWKQNVIQATDARLAALGTIERLRAVIAKALAVFGGEYGDGAEGDTIAAMRAALSGPGTAKEGET